MIEFNKELLELLAKYTEIPKGVTELEIVCKGDMPTKVTVTHSVFLTKEKNEPLL